MGGREKGKQAKEKRSILDPSSSQDTGPLMTCSCFHCITEAKRRKDCKRPKLPPCVSGLFTH